jgi:hypothetical protein
VPAKAANQLKQRLFVFHPPRGRKESGRSIFAALSFVLVSHPPDRGPRAATLGPHPFARAAAVYAGPTITASFAAALVSATTRRSDLLGSRWPSTEWVGRRSGRASPHRGERHRWPSGSSR